MTAGLSTPEPVYDDRKVTTRPPVTLPQNHRLQARNAAVRAQKRYPGAAGELLAAELNSYAEMGWMGAPQSPIVRLIHELTTT